MDVFEKLRAGQSFHVLNDEDYVREAHGEFKRCRHLCWLANSTDPDDVKKIWEIERELFNGNFDATNFLTPPFQIYRMRCQDVKNFNRVLQRIFHFAVGDFSATLST